MAPKLELLIVLSHSDLEPPTAKREKPMVQFILPYGNEIVKYKN